MRSRKELKGLDWKGGAIGNAEWAGARLRSLVFVIVLKKYIF